MLFGALVLWVFGALLERPTWVRATVLGPRWRVSAYTHVYGYMAAPMLVVPVLPSAHTRRRVGRYIAATYAVAGLLFLPWALAIPSQVELVRSQASEGASRMSAPDSIIGSLIKNLGALSPDQRALPGLLFGFLLIAGGIRLAVTSRVGRPRRGIGVRSPRTREGPDPVVRRHRRQVAGRRSRSTSRPSPRRATRSYVCLLSTCWQLEVAHGSGSPTGRSRWPRCCCSPRPRCPTSTRGTTRAAGTSLRGTQTADPNVGVLVQEWETAFNIDTYARILGREESLDALWINSPQTRNRNLSAGSSTRRLR